MLDANPSGPSCSEGGTIPPAREESEASSRREDPILLGHLTRAAAATEGVIAILAMPLLQSVIEPQVVAWRTSCGADVTSSWVAAEVAGGLLALGLAAALLRLGRLPGRAIGLRGERIGAQVLWGLVAPVGVYGVLILFFLIRMGVLWLARRHGYLVPIGKPPTSPLSDFIPADRTAGALLFIAAAAVTEEVLSRGLILTRLRRVFGRWWLSVVVTSVIFAAFHLGRGITYAAGALVISVVLSVFFVWSRSLIAVVMGHALFNCGQFFLSRWLLHLHGHQ